MILYGLAFLYIAWRHYKNIKGGGDPYLQGDWLMNFADGVVRRGFSGEVFLWLSDILNVQVLIVLGVFQLGILAAILGTLLSVAYKEGPSQRLLLVLLSPALVLFWVNDLYTPFRKELLAYFAFVPLFVFRSGPLAAWRIYTSLILFTVAVAFQEANAIFAIPLGLTLWLLLDRRNATRAIAGIAVIAVISSAFAILFQNVPSVDGMCDRLMQEGVSPRVCDGDAPILWLVWTVPRVVAEGMNLIRFDTMTPFIWAGFTILCVFAALAYLLEPVCKSPADGSILLAGAISIAPLFFLGSDWGRFASYQAFSLLFLTLAINEARAGDALSKPVSPLIFAAILAFNLGVGFWHMLPEPTPGFVQVIATAVLRLLT